MLSKRYLEFTTTASLAASLEYPATGRAFRPPGTSLQAALIHLRVPARIGNVVLLPRQCVERCGLLPVATIQRDGRSREEREAYDQVHVQIQDLGMELAHRVMRLRLLSMRTSARKVSCSVLTTP